MEQFLYQGHGSYRIVADSGTVIYIDPYAGEGYDLPADIILVTHNHGDHNQVSMVAQKPDTVVIRATDALKKGVYSVFDIKEVKIEAVEAYNKNHNKNNCVGYVLTVDKITLYAAGDTSMTKQMEELAQRNIDWAVLPIDGEYNMNASEASLCAELISAKNTIPVHMKAGALFDRKKAESFKAQGRVIIEPGETISL